MKISLPAGVHFSTQTKSGLSVISTCWGSFPCPPLRVCGTGSPPGERYVWAAVACSARSEPVLTVTAASPRVLWDVVVGVVLVDHELEAGQDGRQGRRDCWEDDTPLPSPNKQRDLINVSDTQKVSRTHQTEFFKQLLGVNWLTSQIMLTCWLVYKFAGPSWEHWLFLFYRLRCRISECFPTEQCWNEVCLRKESNMYWVLLVLSWMKHQYSHGMLLSPVPVQQSQPLWSVFPYNSKKETQIHGYTFYMTNQVSQVFYYTPEQTKIHVKIFIWSLVCKTQLTWIPTCFLFTICAHCIGYNIMVMESLHSVLYIFSVFSFFYKIN